MELNKVMEGFTVSNNLVIKAQVQVIRCGRPSVRLSLKCFTAAGFLRVTNCGVCNFYRSLNVLGDVLE